MKTQIMLHIILKHFTYIESSQGGFREMLDSAVNTHWADCQWLADNGFRMFFGIFPVKASPSSYCQELITVTFYLLY